MKFHSIARALLLVLVAGSLGAWAWRTWSETRAATSATPSEAAAGVLADGVTVINFHGTRRCPTCLQIGKLSESVVTQDFPDDVSAGRLAWVSIDFDEPAQSHVTSDYELVGSNVVVVRRVGGRELGWSRLDEVWSLNDDEPAFRAYVRRAIDEALRSR